MGLPSTLMFDITVICGKGLTTSLPAWIGAESSSPKRWPKASSAGSSSCWPRKRSIRWVCQASSIWRKVSCDSGFDRSTPTTSAPSAAPVGMTVTLFFCSVSMGAPPSVKGHATPLGRCAQRSGHIAEAVLRLSGLLRADLVAQQAQAFNFGFQDVAGLHELRWGARVADAGGGAGEEQVTGFQRQAG